MKEHRLILAGFHRLFRKEAPTGKQGSFVDRAFSWGENLLPLINDIRDLSKIEAGRMKLKATDLDLQTLVEEVVEFFGKQSQAKGIELVFDISASVPLALRGDAVRLRQILVNLIGNAVKFTGSGSVAVHVSIEEEDRRSVLLRFDVRDTGIGIPPEALPGLFQPFSQEDDSTAHRHGGTGLGLAIARHLVEMMSGTIEARSVPGAGSAFRFTVRLERQVSSSSPTMPPTFSFQGLRILVAAAKTPGRTNLSRQLAGWGIHYACAGEASRAMAMLIAAAESGDSYHAAIIDEAVPEVGGETLLRTIREEARIAGTALIVLTSESDAVSEGRTDVLAHLKKPVMQSQLYNVLLSFWNRVAPALSSPEALSGPGEDRGAYSTCRVLLVDDNAVNRAMSIEMLDYFGCWTDVAEDGRQALDVFSGRSYDLILMDCHMPEMDGYEATRQIRRREAALGETPQPRVPIIALTAHAMTGDREACLAAGMDDYLSKPYKPGELGAILAKWLAAASGTAHGKGSA